MHRVLFDSAAQLGKLPWADLATVAGVPDRVAFLECMKDPRHNDMIARDLRDVLDIGINAVPALVINGVVIMGSKPLPVVERLVQQALAEAKRGG